MVFYASKILGVLASPANIAVALVLVGAVLLYARPRFGRRLVGAGAVLILLLGFSPVPKLAMRMLEDRFPPAAAEGRIDGIVVLGGGANVARGRLAFNEAASRIIEGAALAKRHPEATLVFSGGDAGFFERDEETEAAGAARVFAAAGIAPDRIVLEDRSRTTRENALLTRERVAPRAGERWVLVTSAFHMPRAIGAFRAAGLALEAYPVDYRTSGSATDWWRPLARASEGLRVADLAAKEWLGLLAYRIAGYTDALLPSPAPSSLPGSARR